MLTKAMMYTGDNINGTSRYVLVCEVALGKSKEMLRVNNNYELEAGFNSVVGLGKQAPDDAKVSMVTINDGAMVPLGKTHNFIGNGRENSDFQYNEYVVPDSNQVRMRYLLQFK